MPKVINEDLSELLSGIYESVDIAKISIGPKGKNVSLSNGDIVNDGKRIVDDIQFASPSKDKGAQYVKKLVNKISSDVGGGRTACLIVYQSLLKEGFNLINKGFNTNLLKKGMNLAVKDICEQLDTMAQPAKGKLKEIATISTESEELGKVIAETIEKVGLDSVVTVEESNTFGVTAEIADGLKFDRGYISPYMITNDRQEAEYTDIPVLVTDKKLSFFKDLFPIVKSLMDKGQKDLMIIAEDLDGEALNVCVVNRLKGIFNTLAIKTPGVGDNKKFTLEDLCALTGAEIWTEQNKDVKLGKIKKVKSTKDYTIIQSNQDIKTWITTLKTRRELTDNKWEKDQYDERIAKLSNGIAVIKVGDISDKQVKYLKLKIEDGVNETKRALEEGIVIGGNCAFLNAIKSVKDNPSKLKNKEEIDGYITVLNAIQAPLKQIVVNGNGSSDIVNNIIYNNPSLTIGYDSLENKVVEDMYKEGIIDAVKVVKSVLKYAVADASLVLSLGGEISEELKED